MNQPTNTITEIVSIAGIGGIDKCDHCGAEYTHGVACWALKDSKSLDLCDACLEKYYIVQS